MNHHEFPSAWAPEKIHQLTFANCGFRKVKVPPEIEQVKSMALIHDMLLREVRFLETTPCECDLTQHSSRFSDE
jgi:hypothetical protein